MSVDGKVPVRTNGTETRSNLEASELDPCMEESKSKPRSDFFRRYRDRVCEKSGLSHKGFYIVGGIVILAVLLLIVVIALAAAWPRIPHKYQFPVCEDAECLQAAAQIQEGLNTTVTPCEDLWTATCGGWLKKYPLPKDKSLWNQKQQLIKKESERVRDLIATLELPLHTGTVEWKLKHLYESCLDVDSINTDDERPLRDIISELGRQTNLDLNGSVKMRPLLLFFPLLFTVSYGKPGGSYSYPAPTPSAPPALLSNLGTASPSIAPSLFTPTATVAPELFNLPSATASLAPSILNIPAPTPSIAPSLLINDVVGAGQYGPPVVNIGSHSLGVQPLGYQQLGFQSLGDQYGLGLSQFGLPLPDQGYNFGQSSFNLGNLVAIGSPQIPLGPTELPQVTPTPEISVTAAHFGPVGPTVATLGPSLPHTGEVIVQKHVYVHVAPEEPEERVPHRPIVVPPPRRNYKIIFIKAPTPPTPTAPVIPPPVQDEERTLIYVLVKRPEEQPEIKIQTPPPTTPAKPEVYFIKYNTRKESTASGAVPSGPVLIDNDGTESGPVVEDVAKGSDTTSSSVSIGNAAPTNVALDLNKATLSGGSALSLAVTGSPIEGGSLQVSSTPAPVYGPPQHK